jgi:hypothetical protein
MKRGCRDDCSFVTVHRACCGPACQRSSPQELWRLSAIDQLGSSVLFRRIAGNGAPKFYNEAQKGFHVVSLQLTHVPVAKTGMLIRKPVEQVFEAIVNPEITSKFWFSKGSGKLETGKQVQWDWEWYDMSIQVLAKVVEPNRRVLIEWPGYSGPTLVEWTLAPRKDGTTFLRVS